LTPEISFIPLWVQNMELALSGDDKNGKLIDFSINGKFGYLNRNGNVLLSKIFFMGLPLILKDL